MAVFRQVKTGRTRPVPARMLVGRAAGCALKLDAKQVSGEHATVVWTGSAWEVRDLGSRNGTWVDGKKVGVGEVASLSANSTIAFGDPQETWEVIEVGPPSALAEAVKTGELRAAQDGMLALPDENHPEILVLADSRGRWVIEHADEGPRALSGEELVTAGGVAWRIRVPETHAGTVTVAVGMDLDTVTLRFGVSRDEEHVEVTVSRAGAERELDAREHWYTLLTLARQRIEDRELPPSEQGWVEREDLLKMLGLDANTLNVMIYRARRQLQAEGIDGAASLVEVRRGQRRIGIAAERLEVVPL